jgi:hypothetical protein
MDLLDLNGIQEPTSDLELNAVAAQIRPLPRSVVPSRRFVEQMRLRLLNLNTERASRAA